MAIRIWEPNTRRSVQHEPASSAVVKPHSVCILHGEEASIAGLGEWERIGGHCIGCTAMCDGPRAQQARLRSWAPSSVREVLYRTLYRGVVVWNQTRKRNAWGQVQQRARAASEWITLEAPELRIVSEELWTAVHDRLDASRRQYLRGTKGQLWGRPARSGEAKHLLPGLARCGTCNGSMYVKSRDHGKRRAYFYGCTSFHLRGSTVCTNSLEVPMEKSDLAVLTSIERDVLQPDVIAATLRKAMERLKPQAAAAQDARQGIEKRLATVERDLARLTAAVTAGGELSTVVTAIKERESAREALRLELRATDMAGKGPRST